MRTIDSADIEMLIEFVCPLCRKSPPVIVKNAVLASHIGGWAHGPEFGSNDL